jgi:arylsulfatase
LGRGLFIFVCLLLPWRDLLASTGDVEATRPNIIVIMADDMGSRAVREGTWKLVSSAQGPWELYDLSQDRTELDNRASEQPERVARMAEIFDAWKQ